MFIDSGLAPFVFRTHTFYVKFSAFFFALDVSRGGFHHARVLNVDESRVSRWRGYRYYCSINFCTARRGGAKRDGIKSK
jgi:hypothetical protein